MYTDKSCGVDGLNPESFQVFWNAVRSDFVQLFQRFMSTGELPSEISRTLVYLMLKVKMSQLVKDLHRILLYNVLIRILSTFLIKKLNLYLGSLILDK